MIEAEAIPYEAALLRGERLLVLAPHPDDEVIGCGGVVAQHLRENRPVLVVVATDGAQAGDAAAREEESRRALATLGGAARIEFLRFPDRALGDDVANRIREQLLAFRPDLILVPSPIEIHPDHFALARVFCELVQRDATLFADLAVARVAFYEVGQPLRPNAIVDISDVAEQKYAAIAQHASQLATRDYVAYARGLNAYRAMTLTGVKFGEAYYVVELASLRTIALSELRMRIGAPREIAVTRETVPLSVVIRTKDRPALLREAVDSVLATRYPCEVVIVNDGGAAPQIEGAKIVTHEQSRGRSIAGNEGVKTATNAFVVFLDDDDLFYPEHLATLANASRSSQTAWYTDAISAFLRRAESGAYETYLRQRQYEQDFDRDLLLVDNYIPLPTLLIPRDSFLDLGGFDPAFDLFEDWDFLIRLGQRGDFLRVPRVTCEVRHFEGGSSVVLASPEGSQRFRNAKVAVWRKHASLVTNDVFANAFEKQKRRALQTYSSLVEAKGQTDHALREAARLEREKQIVINQNAETANTVNGYALRVRELEGSLAALNAMANDYEFKTLQVERLTSELASVHAVHRQTHEELSRARVEIDRLNGLLDLIYRSTTWKMHTLVEKFRGRG